MSDLLEAQEYHITAAFPPKLIRSLFADPPARYRVYYGGRSAGKSWSIARALLLEGIRGPLRVLCVREFMSSVNDSVHKTISDQIGLLGLQDHYKVEKSGIYGVTHNTEFRFAGIRNNPDAIRSFEGVDVTYCEEAANISRNSWITLEATVVRKQGSRMIISFNPVLESDETWQRWVVNPPPDTVVTKINYLDNPFATQESRDQAEHMRLSDPDLYHNVWLGFPKVYLENAIYGKELRTATEEGRLCKVPYDETVKVDTFWDLGRRDLTAIIFAQVVAMEYRVIDYIQDSGLSIHDYLKMLNKKPYVYGIDFLPHDAKAHTIGTKLSIEEMMRANGRRVQIVPRLSIVDGINAARAIFNRLYIDEKKCHDLIQCLRQYKYEVVRKGDDEVVTRETPLHDENSHAADALRMMALSLRPPKIKAPVEYADYADRFATSTSQLWMNL